jgi:inner membrane protein
MVLKLVGIGILVLLLLIPLSMIHGVLDERLERRDQAVDEITSTWGLEQRIFGPVWIIPYRYSFTAMEEQESANGLIKRQQVVKTAVAQAYFLPEVLEVKGDVQTETRYRGIFRAAVYRGEIELNGSFAPPNWEALKIKPSDVLWNEARVTMAVSDLRGVREALQLQWDGKQHPLLPGCLVPGYDSGLTAPVGETGPLTGARTFMVKLDLNGSKGLYFAPFGVQNRVKVVSNWAAPGFRGAFLPSQRNVSATGFDALWQMTQYGRSYPSQWTEKDSAKLFNLEAVKKSEFGVAFVSSLDVYRYVERSIKYGILFIVLLFTAFFLFELTSGLRLHPFQYSLVGATLCLFYLALLSISEFWGFGLAYGLAAVAATLLTTWYSHHFLGAGYRTVIIFGGLVGVYGFLYITLKQEDYALLMGTIGLFVVLAVVMYATRKINWYAGETR